MRTCHICENIVKVIASLTCASCRRSHCYPCIKQYHKSETDRLIPKTEEEALKRPALNACFVCLKTCQCRKCNIKESVVVVPENAIVPEKQDNKDLDMKSGEIIPEGILFGNQKMGDLPDYLQRVMVSKKTLYSKHLTSIPSSNNLPLPSPSKEEIAKAQLKSGSLKVEVPMIGESVEVSLLQENNSISREVHMDVENRNESRVEEVEQEGVSNLFGESSLVENEDEEGGSMAVENQQNQEVNVESGAIGSLLGSKDPSQQQLVAEGEMPSANEANDASDEVAASPSMQKAQEK